MMSIGGRVGTASPVAKKLVLITEYISRTKNFVAGNAVPGIVWSIGYPERRNNGQFERTPLGNFTSDIGANPYLYCSDISYVLRQYGLGIL